MSANISDKFNKASNMGGNYPPVATVTSARTTSGSTLSCDDLSGWATDTPVHFSTFKVNADGTIDTSTQTDWKGIVIGNTITEMTRLAGAADSGNASGDKVELNPTVGWLDDLITGILVSHKQDGTLRDSIVDTNAISDGAVASAKLASNAVTTAKINDAAVTSAKIDWTTFNPTNEIGKINDWANLPTTSQDLVDSITISESGKYLLVGRAFVQVISYGSDILILKNSATLASASADTSGSHSLSVITLEELSAGDVVHLQGKTDGSGKYFSSRDRLELICIRVG